MSPLVVHVIRPYDSEQEFLMAEAWTIDSRSMLLVDAAALAPDTAVLFDLTLGDGSKPLRAEGRVVGLVAPKDGRPGGLRVRFRRFGAATKAFIERAVKFKTAAGEPERLSRPEAELPSQPGAERLSMVDVEQPSMVDVEQPSVVDVERPSMVDVERLSSPELRPSMTELEATPPAPPPPSEASQTRQRAPGPVVAPTNREELLARLRLRRRTG